jgi:hypothetical protein
MELSPLLLNNALMKSCILFLALAFSFGIYHLHAAPLPIGPWSGAVGPVGSTMLPDPSRPPVEFFEDGAAGRLSLTLASPTTTAPNGTYTAQLDLYNGTQAFTFRYKGSLKLGGGIQDIWVASGKTPASITISMNRSVMDPEAPFLTGEAVLSGSRYPVFAMPHLFTKKSPLPASVAGAFAFFLHDQIGSRGTGFGSATITPDGGVKVAGTSSDGSKFTQSSNILYTGGQHFFASAGLVGKTGFIGAWALRDPSFVDSDWSGYARHGQSSTYVTRVILSSNAKIAGQSALSWTAGSLHLELNPDFFVANGDVTFDGKSRFTIAGQSSVFLNGANPWGVQLKSLQLNLSTGLATGSVEYYYIPVLTSELRVKATLSGALNKKSGEIHGRIQAARNPLLSGPFQVSPR